MEENKQLYEVMFMQLVMSMESSAWMLLGKIANPMTGKVEQNLDGAKATIDTLMMLKEKTKGNLSNPEESYISNVVQQLQLNYIEVLKTEDTEKKKSSEEEKPKKPIKKGKKKKKKTKK